VRIKILHALHLPRYHHHHSLKNRIAAPELYQASTISALMANIQKGGTACAQLIEHGDLGPGTFNKLDGEMIPCDVQVF
jgi:hypothetical protein